MSGDRMVLRELAFDAASNLQALKGRTVLALVGIAIGTAAVIAMLHIGYNARKETMQQFDVLGIDLVNVTPRSDGMKNAVIPLETARDVAAVGVGVIAAAPFILTGTSVRIGRSSLQANLVAATDGIYSLAKAEIATGRRTSDLDGFAPFAVLGAVLAKDIAASTGRLVRIGDQISLDGQVMTVIGILAGVYSNMVLGLDLDRSVVIPYAAARRLIPSPQITNVAARIDIANDDTIVSEKISEYFGARMRGGGGVSVQTARQLIATLDQQMRIYGLLLLAIGTVSLVVGGVGVMNVMLMSVMERRREIGIRLAIGARRHDIRVMFLIEALLLSAAGSAIGTVLGTLTGWLFARSSGWTFAAAPAALPLGAGMALVVGLFFGSYPAARAARLDPIVALRSD
ncbi:ABC transporter permease [Bradyrhizobium sp.]|jgi:putative ABC transport system permease protein|uniref:ABC transporter permease n=1 Tax=Bradyrhizobium sp. TaxID=376 RepID=UPI002DDD8E0C|nr:ABC transporter permease [Bradyrhizobium sp.]HEV2153201.1 ABC transporter permease [Bradyrhizobium sp.]